jgi:hypothetical protein
MFNNRRPPSIVVTDARQVRDTNRIYFIKVVP